MADWDNEEWIEHRDKLKQDRADERVKYLEEKKMEEIIRDLQRQIHQQHAVIKMRQSMLNKHTTEAELLEQSIEAARRQIEVLEKTIDILQKG